MNLFQSLVIVVLAELCLVGITATQLSLSQPQNEEDSVRKVLLDNARAFEKGDLNALENLWANDEKLTVFEEGHSNTGWIDYRDHHLKPELKEMKEVWYSLSNLQVHLAGTTAWATFEYTISGISSKDLVQGGGFGTAVLEKRKDQWRIVHWHSSSKPKKR